MQRTTQYYHPKETSSTQRTRDINVAGFYQGEDADDDEEDDTESNIHEDEVSFDSVSYWREPLPEIDLDLLEDLCNGEDEGREEEIEEDVEDGDDFGYDSDKENAVSEEGEDSVENDDDDDDSWITPSNLKDKKKQFTGDFRGEQESKVGSVWLFFLNQLKHLFTGGSSLHDNRFCNAKCVETDWLEHPWHRWNGNILMVIWI